MYLFVFAFFSPFFFLFYFRLGIEDWIVELNVQLFLLEEGYILFFPFLNGRIDAFVVCIVRKEIIIYVISYNVFRIDYIFKKKCKLKIVLIAIERKFLTF